MQGVEHCKGEYLKNRENLVNPKQAGGYESMYSLRGALENRYRVEMHVQSQIFQGQILNIFLFNPIPAGGGSI